MTVEFTLPDVGEGLTEATVITWRVAPGDDVAVNEVFVEIETAKSVVELPAPEAGRVDSLLVEEGQTVAVGTPLLALFTGESDGRVDPRDEGRIEAPPESPVVTGESPIVTREPMLVGYGPSETSTRRRRRRRGDIDTTSASAAVTRSPGSAGEEPRIEIPPPGSAPHHPSVLAKPPVRKLAKDLGIDLRRVPHEGEIVTRADVQAFADSATEHPIGHEVVGPESDTVPVVGVRKATADAMIDSAFTAPHVTVWRETDVSATVDFLAKVRSRHPEAPVTVLTLIAFAVCRALRRNRDLNATWRDDHIALHPHVDLGFAVASDRGLLVPHVPRADEMSLLDLASALDAMKEKTRSGRATPAELSGGTFTITNVGVFDVDGGTPILVPGQSGILSAGRIVRKPWVVEDEVVPRDVMTLALSFDHRVVDGEQGARFLADVAALLTDPVLLSIG